MKASLFIFPTFLVFCAPALHAQVFTGDGDWFDTARWDTGIVPGDNSFVTVNGNASIASDIAAATGENPGNITIGDGVDGSITVTGGTVSGANFGGGAGGGVFVGLNGGSGMLTVNQGATFRSQGGGMPLQIGDNAGGVGFVSVLGEFQNYKLMNLINGTLEMHPSAINNKFNSNDQSTIGAGGTLSYIIDGSQVGALLRSNATGLVMAIDPAATLKITLGGSFALNDSWTLMSYTTLTVQFAQGTTFINEQGAGIC